jgi:hypothetical protein
VYIKGRPGGGLGKKQEIESQVKRIRSLVIETLAIPPQTGLGLYLHRKGLNQYKLLVSFVLFNPFKLTSSQWLRN